MNSHEVMHQLVRRRLTTCATLTAMVGSQAIKVAQGRPPTTCPAIRLRVVGGSERRPKSLLRGDLFINIYSKSLEPAQELASIYSVVYQRLNGDQASMATTNGAVGAFYEEMADYPLYDEEGTADRFYLTSRFRYSGQNKTLL